MAVGAAYDAYVLAFVIDGVGPGYDEAAQTTPLVATGPPYDANVQPIITDALGSAYEEEVNPPSPFSGVIGGTAVLPSPQGFGPTTGGTALLSVGNGFGGTTGGVVIFTTLPAPSNLVATVIDAGDVDLTWVDSSAGAADGFRVERSLTGQNDWEVIGTTDVAVTIFRDRFAVPLVTYDYRVFAFDSIGDSLQSNIAMATTPLPPDLTTPPPPVPPTDPQRDQIDPENVDFLSPGIYGLEKDQDGNITGFKF